MKRLITIIIALVAIAGRGMAQQEKAEQLFDQFINDPTYSGCVKLNAMNQNTDDDKCTSLYNFYTFALPTQWRNKVEKLADSLGAMRPTAYNFFLRSANSGDKSTVKVSVEGGTDVVLGTYPDRNYLAIYFRSATDSLRRHAYLMAWYDDVENDCVKGSLYKIYGLDPKKKAKTVVSRKIYINGEEIDIDDFNIMKQMGISVNENGRVSFGNNRSTTSTTSTVTVVKNQNATAREAKREEAKQKIETITTSPLSVTNSTEFIAEFKNLHDLFIAVQGDYATTQKFQSSILNRMDGMVQEKGSLLTMKEERQLCIKILKSMKKNVFLASDSVMSAHVDLIIKRLKKL